MIFYNQEVVAMSKRLVKLSDRSLKKSFEFIDDLQPFGGTNIHDALERGFDYATHGAQAALDGKGIDTVFLLSDGVPTVGQLIETREILKKFKEKNRLSKLVIHTVYVGLNTTVDDRRGNIFMKALADQNGGEFKGPPEE